MSDENTYTMVTFRPTTLAPELQRRGERMGRVAKRDLSRYYWMLSQEEFDFDLDEWTALEAFVATREWAPEDVPSMRELLQQFLQSPMGGKYKAPNLVNEVRGLSYIERVALIDLCEIMYLAVPTEGATSAA